MNKKITPILVLLALFLLLRLPAAMSSIYQVYDSKELYIGTVARELIQGLKFPLFDHQLRHNVGGSLVFGILAVPYFLIFGQAYFTLKLLALSWSALIIVFWYIFIARYFNRRAAFLTGLFFVFSPPSYSKFSLMSYGQHAEANLFIIGGMLLFFSLFFSKPEAGRNYRGYAWFGLLSGFAMYFDPIYFSFLVVCFIFWVIYDRRFYLSARFGVFLGSFVLGFGPWIYYHASQGFRVVCLNDRFPEPARTMRELFPPNLFLAGLNNFKGFLFTHLPDSFCFENFSRGPFNYFYYLLFLTALFFLVRFSLRPDTGIQPPEKRAGLFLASVPFLHLILMSVIAYAIDFLDHDLYRFYGYRRFLPLYPFMFAILAVFLDRLYRSGKPFFARSAAIIGVAALLLGVVANLRMIRADNFSGFLYYPGYSYSEFGNLMARKAGADIHKAVNFAQKIGEADRGQFYEGIGIYWGYYFYKKLPLKQCIDELSLIAPAYRSFALRGAGISIAGDCWDDMKKADQVLSGLDPAARPALYQGAGEWAGLIFGHRPGMVINMASPIDPVYQPDFYRGVGRMVASKFGQDKRYCTGIGERIEARYRPFYFLGLASQQ